MSRARLRQPAVTVLFLSTALALSACARGVSVSPDSASPRPVGSPAACAGAAEAAVAPDASRAPDSGASGILTPPGDGPPNYADNHRYLQRRSLSGKQRAGAMACAARVRSGLDRLRTQNVYDRQSVVSVLTEVGLFNPDAYPVTPSPGASPAPVGVLFYAYSEQGVCVFGEHSQQRTAVEVDGSTGEGACITR